MPAKILVRLKKGERMIAEHDPAVSVLFADVVGFTSMTRTVGAQASVAWLDHLFSDFDSVVHC